MALSKPRETALKVLREIDENGAYLNIALEKALDEASMDARDSALCSNIVMGSVKNRGYIDHVISRISSVKMKKLSVWILNILRMGIYCIKFTDKIPVSATVDECVKLSRRYGHASSAGYVNAVLRKAASSTEDFTKGLKGNELLSVKYSMPLWIVEKWQKEQSDFENLIRAMNEEPPVYCRLNSKAVPDSFVPTNISPYTLLYTCGGGVVHSEAYKKGLVNVQDGASQLAVLALQVKKGSSVLDLCAAPGGKSVFAAYLGASVTACDLYEHKIKLIENNAARLGVRVDAAVNDACVFNPDFENKFDGVIVDAPCSGLGIIRRKPDIKWRKAPSDGLELAMLQQSILTNASRYVKRGGRLIYSTCTISKGENEGIARWFSKKFPEFSPSPLGVGPNPKSCLVQLRPDLHATDGFFIAAFERK